jgi:hypothetical protein
VYLYVKIANEQKETQEKLARQKYVENVIATVLAFLEHVAMIIGIVVITMATLFVIVSLLIDKPRERPIGFDCNLIVCPAGARGVDGPRGPVGVVGEPGQYSNDKPAEAPIIK